MVTASVDKISMKKPLNLETDLKMKGAVAWVGRSSMQIRMEVIQPVRGKSQTNLYINFKECLFRFILVGVVICSHVFNSVA